MKKVVLMILDGWGHGREDDSNGIYLANTPFIDGLYDKYPHSTLVTYGEEVGLPEGQMGNSEVGHLNIGAGRIVYQDLLRINNAIKDGSFYDQQTLIQAFKAARANNKSVHLLGLTSKGGVHSSLEHLKALTTMADEIGVEKTFIHAFTDGRDCDPRSAEKDLAELEVHIQNQSAQVASVIGRYYAMDRDKRWERVKKAYDLLVSGVGTSYSSSLDAVQASYSEGVTDEFIEPKIITNEEGEPIGTIEEGDVVICFNFRTDRCREITMALTQQDFPDFDMATIPLHYVTMTNYDKTFKGVNIVFDKENLKNTMGEVMEQNGKKQIRIAETEKYPHVTFFFNGGREEEFDGELRIMANSPKVATYDLKPEMSAPEITSKICAELEKGETDFVCLNFANGDMVGHTGVPKAIVSACECVDNCTKEVIETGLANGYSFIVIADHGNADKMKNEDGSAHTAHTLNLVPCIVIDENYKSIKSGKLADVSPTILKMMNISQPSEMTGESLV